MAWGTVAMVWPIMATRGRPIATRGHPMSILWSFLVTFGHSWPLMDILEPLMAAYGHLVAVDGQLMAVIITHPVATHGHPVTAFGIKWPPLAIHSRSWPPGGRSRQPHGQSMATLWPFRDQ